MIGQIIIPVSLVVFWLDRNWLRSGQKKQQPGVAVIKTEVMIDCARQCSVISHICSNPELVASSSDRWQSRRVIKFIIILDKPSNSFLHGSHFRNRTDRPIKNFQLQLMSFFS